ncbi:MAG: hypothetical protein WCO44_03045 [Bacteroidota bacterium]
MVYRVFFFFITPVLPGKNEIGCRISAGAVYILARKGSVVKPDIQS